MNQEHGHKNSSNTSCPYCGKEFETRYQLAGHMHGCKMHPLKEYHDLVHKQIGQTIKKNIASGKIIPPQTGKPLSIETR